MLKILSKAEGEVTPESPTPKKVSVFGIIEFGFGGILLGLIAFILLLVALNYFNILSLSKMNPKLFSLLPTSVPVPGSCKVVEEKFCPQAVLLEKEISPGNVIKFVGFNLPPGTPIFSNLDSHLLLVKSELRNEIKGMKVSIGGGLQKDPSIPNFNFYGDLDKITSPDVNKGDVMGYIGDTGVTNFGYNLIITVGDARDNEENMERFLKPMFPEAFEKPAK